MGRREKFPSSAVGTGTGALTATGLGSKGDIHLTPQRGVGTKLVLVNTESIVLAAIIWRVELRELKLV